MRLIYTKLLKISLVTKVTLGVGSILVLAVVISTMISLQHSEKLLMKQATESMRKSLQVHKNDLKAAMDEVTQDAQLISNGAGVQNLIKAWEKRKVDPEQNASYLAWQNNMERMFATMIRNKGYLQVRFISLDDGGRELVRADAPAENGQPIVFSRGKDLQQKGHRDYVQVGARLKPGQAYVSPINLNREQGEIQTPWQPTQRFVTPVFLNPIEDNSPQDLPVSRKIFGVIVINTDASKVITDMVGDAPYSTILVNDQGGVLYHEDETLPWQFEFDPDAILSAIDTHAWQKLLKEDQGIEMKDSRGHAHAAIQVPLGDTGEHFLGIILAPLQSDLLSTSDQLKRSIVSTGTLSLLLALLLSLVLVRHLFTPITQLTRQAELLTAGQLEEIQLAHGKDEVGRLGQAFADLVTQLQARRKEADFRTVEVQELNKSLEDKVAQRTRALENSQSVLQLEATTREAMNTALGLSLYTRTPEELLLGALDLLLDLDFLAIEQKAAAFVVENNSRELTLVAHKNFATPLRTLCAKVPFGKCYCGMAAEEETVLFKSCVDSDHAISFDGMAPHGHYNVPLVDGPDVVGMLALYLPHGAKRNEKEIEFLNNFATILAGALRRFRIEEDLEKARKDAEEANLSKSDFLANMSHEIRTPMTAILGYTDVLNEPNLPEEERIGHVHTIKQNGNHLLTIINDILDVSKIESGKMEVEMIPLSIWDIVEDVLELLSVKAKDRGIELLADFQYPLPETIISDPVRLRQIMLNLLGNSIKFTENGEVRIAVSLVENKLQLAISDTGIGMTPEQAKRLFKPFTQADASTTRKFGGTGLGLTICKHLSEMMGGGITLESKLNHGSTFTVQINPGDLSKTTLVDEKPRKSDSAAHACHQNSSSFFTGRILLAEDTLVNQKLAARMLTKAGHTVEAVNNGKEALDLALEQWRAGTPFEVILMDMQMPIMDGYEATAQLRAENYPLPIIALTANAMASDREKCLNAGCNDFATKPFQKAKLLHSISTWLEKNQSLPV